MAYPSLVFPRNSLSWEKEKVSFFRHSQRLLHGGRGDNRPPPSLIPFSFPFFSVFFFYIASFFLIFDFLFFLPIFVYQLLLYRKGWKCMSGIFYIYIYFFFPLIEVLFPLSIWFCCSFCRESISWLVRRLSIFFSPIRALSLSSCFLFCLCFCCFLILRTQSIRLLASNNCFTLSYSFFFSVERVIDSPVYQVGRLRALFFLLAL